MSLANTKIGTRLALGFAAILALLVATLLLGLNSVAKIGDQTRDIVTDKNVKLAAAKTMVDNVRSITLAITSIVLVKTDTEAQAELAKIADARKNYGAAYEVLVKKLANDRERALIAAVEAALKAGKVKNNQVVSLRMEGQIPEATAYLIKEATPELQLMLKTLEDVIAYETEQANRAGAESEHVYAAARALMITLGALAVLIGAAIAWFITRSITGPINKAVAVAETVASGDLSSRIEVDSTDETGRLLSALKAMNDSLLKVVGEVRSGTDMIATASTEIAAGNMDLSSRTEQQAASLEETASSMEDLTGTVKQNADHARQANQLSATASEVAVRGGALVSQVVETMSTINASSRKIVDIIAVIDGIAFQTNILALNAAVEAARAGEQGRGFAVVATEVRNLAQRSALAAREIKELIATSVDNVNAGSQLVNNAGQTMGEIVTAIQRVTDIMGEISSANTEQTDGIEQINTAITRMDAVTQQNAALVEQAAAASQSMQTQAASLAAVVGFFKTGAEHIVAAPRALPAKPAAKTRPPLRAVAPARRLGNTQPAAHSDWEEF